MPYWPPDSAPSEPPQMPQAATPGPAPVPYGGPGFALAPDICAPLPGVSPDAMPGGGVMDGVTGANYVTESPLAAPGVNPYEAGATDPIVCSEAHMGPENCDTVAATVAAAVANAQARADSRQRETYGQGSVIGDVMTFPPSHLDPAQTALHGGHPGITDPSGAYYDPPRDYGNEPQ
jgi:hypothetical protein